MSVPSSVAVSARCRHFFQRALRDGVINPDVTSCVIVKMHAPSGARNHNPARVGHRFVGRVQQRDRCAFGAFRWRVVGVMFVTSALLARAAKRVGFLKLTTKRARKGYYKGKGAIGTGRFTKAGNYVVEAHKAPNFIVPNVDLASFPLKPYVASTVPKRPELVGKAPPGAAYSTLRAAR